MSVPPEALSPQPTSGDSPGATQSRRHNLSRFRLSWLERFFLFLSRTDLHALQFCADETRSTQSSIGAMVLVTGVMAFVSSFFAIENTFFRHDYSELALFTVIAVASFYALAIILFDREVVSAIDKRAIFIRIPFAFLIGMIISFPLEMKLMQARIDTQITNTAEQRNTENINEVNSFYTKKNEAVTQALQLQQSLVVQSQQIESSALRQYKEECGRGYCGPRAAKLHVQLEQATQAVAAAERGYDEARPRIVDAINRRFAPEEKRIEGLQKEVDRQMQAHDFLTQYEALHEIERTNPVAWRISLALQLFFVMFELFPVLIKLVLPYTEYHAYLDARRRISVNKIIGVANFADVRTQTELQREGANFDDIRSALSREVTDILEDVMEDRQVDYEEPDEPSESRR